MFFIYIEDNKNLPEANVYQIVGHTPVFNFDIQGNHIVRRPFVLAKKDINAEIQFSDVGIGYAYKDDSLDRPKVIINNKYAMRVEG